MIFYRILVTTILLVSSVTAEKEKGLVATLAKRSSAHQGPNVDLAKIGNKRTNETIPANPCGCGERVVELDFNEIKAGAYVNELLPKVLSVRVKGRGSYYGDGTDAARIFDTSDPKPDFSLGSPNEACGDNRKAVGKGEAGKPGSDYENCVALKNVLIIQRAKKNRPDDAEDGGQFRFKFDLGVEYRLARIGLLDVEGIVTISTTNLMDGKVHEIRQRGAGSNGYQELSIVKPIRYMSDFKVTFRGQGAITSLTMCRKGTADEIKADVEKMKKMKQTKSSGRRKLRSRKDAIDSVV